MAVTSHGFESPPINNSVSPAFAVDFNLERNSSHIFAVLHDLKTSANTNLDFGQVTRAAHLAAHLISPGAVIPQGTNVGILVSTSSIMYIALVLGVMRAGLVPFPLSPRTPVAGISSMLAQTNTSYLVAGGGPAINSLTSTLQSELELKLIPLPSLDDIFPCLNGSTLEISHRPFPVLQPTTGNTIMAILHSSGSSGMPRPVSFDWEGIIKNVLTQPPVQIYNQPGTQVGTLGIPTFHMMGFMVQCMAPLFLGYSQVLFHPNSQPLIPSPDATIRAMAGTGCPLLITAPTFLEIWSHNEDAITQLKQMERVTFGGGPLAEWVGEKLTKRGVRLYSGYGATELGAIIQGWDAQTDPDDWAYVKFSQQCDVRFLPQEDNEGSYEIVAVTCDEHKPWVLNFEIDGKPAYRTSDLAVPHLTKPGLWKLIGRLDDQIILQNGEKTNPVPMEIEVSESPLIQSAIIFGRARNQTGILIDLAEGAKRGFKDKEGRAGLVDQIWPYIERANRISSTHSRLSKDAIILVDPARPLPRTPKGTISRSGSLAAYAKEIEEMYSVLEGSITLSAQVGAPESWSQEEAVKGWVQLCVENILGRKVEVDGDLFQQGMDSLTATMLLRTLKNSLFSSGDSTVRQASEILNQQTIFSNPTIGQLARNIVDICTGERASSTDDLTSIRSMIQKYESKWTNKTISLEMREETMKERVVLTGTTGGLGSHLLAVLLGCEEVERVWALNRNSKEGVAARQRAAFEDKMLDVGLLESEKLVMVEADLGDGKLGLSDKEYHEIQTGATIIIHNAWQVNFNLSLQSFEPSIQGACNLLDLAFSSPARPRFLFTSSISAAGFGKPGQRLYEEYLELKDVTTGFGYGQSKLVTEKILESARAAGLETSVLRLGQLTGDEKGGAWTVSDWVPSMIASSVSIGCLPDTIGSVSWLPLDVAARSIVDVCFARRALLSPVMHISHPHPVEWTDIISLFADALKCRMETIQSLPIVPFQDWNERVRDGAAAFRGSEGDRHKRFPSTKVQSTFDGIAYVSKAVEPREMNADVEAGGLARLDTTQAEKLSENLKNVPRLGKEHVERWVRYWERRGLFV